MQSLCIRFAALLVLFVAGGSEVVADPAPATPSVDNRRTIKVTGNSQFDGKEAPKTDKPLAISVAALRGKWEWNQPGTAKLVLEFTDSTDFAYTHDGQNKLAVNPNGRAQLSIDIPNVGGNAPALAWDLDIANRRVRLSEVDDEGEVGSPGRGWSAEIQLVRDDVLQIQGRLPTLFAELEFDGLFVKVPPKVIEDVADLVRRLGRNSPKEVRLAAANQLQEADQYPAKETVPVLVGWVSEKDKDIRIAGLNTLTVMLMQTKGECPLAVVEAIFDMDYDISCLAAALLGCYEKFPREAVPLLFRGIEHESQYVRGSIPSVLVKAARHDKRTLPALKKALEDSDRMVRGNAAAALLDATHNFDLVVPYWLIANENYQELTETARATLTADQQSAQDKYNLEARFAIQTLQSVVSLDESSIPETRRKEEGTLMKH